MPLRELVKVSDKPVDQPIYRKNLKPVIYVTGDVAGAAESPAYAIFAMNKKLAELDGRQYGGDRHSKIEIYNLHQPFTEHATGHQVGRRVAYHPGGLPRSGAGLLRGDDPHLHADGRLVQGLLSCRWW